MTFPDVNSRKYKTLSEGVRARTFWGEKMLMALVDIDANAIISEHHHPHEQVGIVLHGELDFYIEEEHRLLHEGEVYIIPSNINHKVICGSEPAQVLDIFSPVREEYKY